MTDDIHLDLITGDDLLARVDRMLATGITPPPWEATDEIGVEWFTIKLPDGAVSCFAGIGGISVCREARGLFIEFVVAAPDTPGAAERRAWLRAAVKQLAGPSGVEIHASDLARIARGGKA